VTPSRGEGQTALESNINARVGERQRALFSLEGQVAIVTGGTGTLGSAMARGLADAGAAVGVMGRRTDRAREIAQQIRENGGEAVELPADVLQWGALLEARQSAIARWGRIDILVNAAGGNVPGAVTEDDRTFFDLPAEALRKVVDLNLLGTILPCQVFGEAMAQRSHGCIVTISSMAATRVLTRVAGYSASKAAVEQLTRWLAVDLARRFGAGMRVNAIAPGFFLAEQNRSLLTQPDGGLTERGETIIGHTPAGRFGEPEDLIGTLIWLCSPGAAFVNGAVVPVDGGFSAFSGV
jgi:NAD(P)-dependent dehydrogenase (short-subunit alcohol dehydrogenase family)